MSNSRHARITFFTGLAVMLSSCLTDLKVNKEIDIETVFANPSEESKPWVYWYWMRANATFEGITRDLLKQWPKRV